MARVISWVIGGKYVYIEKQGASYICDSKIGDESTKLLGNRVMAWDESTYETNFNAMRNEVVGKWGSSVDMRNDYKYYFNATGNEGVYMLTGIDGANIADYGKPFYNFVIENNNTSVGLGGDYVLDKATVINTTIWFEKNGSKYAPESAVVYLGNTIVTGASMSDGYETPKKKISIPIPQGTQFDINNPVLEYTIEAAKDGYSGRTVFSVVGVKNGEEGVSYDLLVSPKTIKVTEDGNISGYMVRCSALKNGENAASDANLKVKYTFGQEATIDSEDLDDDAEYPLDDDSFGIPYETVALNGDQVNFYLLFNGMIVDTDSCIISRDGRASGSVKLELDNEIDGVSVGEDSVLDIDGSVEIGTGFVLYSGGTAIELSGKIKVEEIDFSHASYQVGDGGSWYSDSSIHSVAALDGAERGFVKFKLENGFDFGEDYRDAIKITVYGINSHGEETSATGTYTVMGIRGGKDGEVYKIIPNLDAIVCDPNEDVVFNTGLTPYLTAEAYKDLVRIENADIRYSKNITYSTYSSTIPMPADGISISELIEDKNNKYVALYLWIGDGTEGGRILADRETVPIIWQGADGFSNVWVELGNEVDAVSVGSDTDLDLENDVKIGTTVRVMSGGTAVRIQNIRVIAPVGTETNWNQYTEFAYGWDPSDNNSHTIGTVSITLKDGFEFGSDLREVPTISVTTENGWQGTANYVIKGVPGGKDGYVYRLMPEVDYVGYNPNEGANGLDQNNVWCKAFYGNTDLGIDKIYYSVNKMYDEVPSTIPDSSVEECETGFTKYTDSVAINGINRTNYKKYKYIAFYLVIDGEIIDRETVKIVSDGIGASDRVTIELTNEIESIGVGTDSKLDVSSPVSASTGVRMFSGSSEMTITDISGTLTAHGDAAQTLYSTGWTASDNTFFVGLYNGFEFGEDLKEKIVIDATATNGVETARTSATFVLAAVKGGKDGVSFKIQPTPDYAVYDLQLGEWVTSSSVTATAMMNNAEITGTGYEIKYGLGETYDIDEAETHWDSLSAYTGPVSFSVPTGASRDSREQYIVFYLKYGDIVVDRETVPLVINGKEGRDGIDGQGVVVFDMSNENWVVGTGGDNVLDVENDITGGTYVSCTSGNGYANITLTVDTAITSDGKCAIDVEGDSESPFVKVTLKNGFTFGESQRVDIPITAVTSDGHFSESMMFGIVCVANGKDGVTYSIRTNVASIIYDSNNGTYSPNAITANLYEGDTNVTSEHRFRYVILDATGGTVSGPVNVSDTTILSDVAANLNGLILGKLVISAETVGGGYRDSCEIPILPSGKNGTGIVVDLTNDSDTVALGSDMMLNTSVTFTDTFVTAHLNSEKISITAGSIEKPSDIPTALKNKIITTASTVSNGEYKVTIKINAPFDFGDSTIKNGRLPFNINVTADTTDGPVGMKVKYTIVGVKGGKDGEVYRIVPSCNVIKKNVNTGEFTPSTINAVTEVNGVVGNFHMAYSFDEDHIETAYTAGTDMAASALTASGMNTSITFYAYNDGSRTELLDKETIFIISDGKDSEGGLELHIAPESRFVRVDSDSAVIAATTANTTISMYTGTSVAEISTFSAEGLPPQFTMRTGGTGNERTISIGIPQGYVFPADGCVQVTITAGYGSNTASTRTKVFSIYANSGIDGAKGARGPITRMRDWQEGVEYFDGSEDDVYWDYVFRNGYYYGCIKDVPSTWTVPPEQDYEGADGVTNPHWQRYEGATFTATQIGFFGEGIDGWVINSDLIQHTSSSITLSRLGAIELRGEEEHYYEYEDTDDGHGKVYTYVDYENDTDAFNRDKGSTVEVIVGNTAGTINTTDYVLSAKTAQGVIHPVIKTSDTYRNIPLYFTNASYSNISPRANISELVGFDVPVTIFANFTATTEQFSVPYTAYTNGQFVNYTYQNTGYCTLNASAGTIFWRTTISAGTVSSSTMQSGAIFATGTTTTTAPSGGTGDIDPSFPEEVFTGLENTLEYSPGIQKSGSWVIEVSPSPDRPLGAPLFGATLLGAVAEQEREIDIDTGDDGILTPETSWTGNYTITRKTVNYDFYLIDLALRSNDNHVSEAVQNFVQNKVNVYVNTAATSSNLTTEITGYGNGTIVSVANRLSGKDGDSDMSEDYTFYSTAVSGSNIPLFAEINPSDDVSKSSSLGKIVLSSGIKDSVVSLVKWEEVSPTGTPIELYSLSDFSSEGVGNPVVCYTGNIINGKVDTPTPVLMYKVNDTEIVSSEGSVFTKSDDVLDNQDGIRFGATRIYEDGSLYASSIYAVNGFFSGEANIRNGKFSGYVDISGGTISGTKIVNSDISGSLSVGNGGVFQVLDSNGYQVIEMSSRELTPGQVGNHSYSIPPISNSDTNSDNFGRKSGVFSGTLISINVTSGTTVTIPAITTTLSFRRNIASVSSSLYYTAPGRTKTVIPGSTISVTDTDNTKTSTSQSVTFTATETGEVTITYLCNYKLKSKSFGSTPKITMAISSSYSVNASNSASGANYANRHYVIGNNGFIFNNGNNAEISLINTSTTNAQAYIKVSGNSIFIDQNTFTVTVGGTSANTYKTLDLYEIARKYF